MYQLLCVLQMQQHEADALVRTFNAERADSGGDLPHDLQAIIHYTLPIT